MIEQFASKSDAEIQAFLREVDVGLLASRLKHSSPATQARFFENLSESTVKLLREEMDLIAADPQAMERSKREFNEYCQIITEFGYGTHREFSDILRMNVGILTTLLNYVGIEMFSLAVRTHLHGLQHSALSDADKEDVQRVADNATVACVSDIHAAQRRVLVAYEQLISDVAIRAVEQGLILPSRRLSKVETEFFFVYLQSHQKIKFLALAELEDDELLEIIKPHNLQTLALALSLCAEVHQRVVKLLPKSAMDRIDLMIGEGSKWSFSEAELAQQKILETFEAKKRAADSDS